MAIIKSYTDLEQSKKLAEILPLETADMCFANDGTAIKIDANPYTVRYSMWKDCVAEIIPCWSLASLLGIIPILDNRSPILSKTFDRKYRVVYHSTAYEKTIYTEDFDNPIDACVAMIEKLHKLKML